MRVCVSRSLLLQTLWLLHQAAGAVTTAAVIPPWKTPDGVYTQVPPAAGAGLRSKVCAGGGCVRNDFFDFSFAVLLL